MPSAETAAGSPVDRNRPVDSAASSSAARAELTSLRSAASPRTTTSAVVPSDGKAVLRSRIVCTSGIEVGRVSRLAVCVFMPSAGTASRITTTDDIASAASGCRVTGPRTRPLTKPVPIRRVRRWRSGTRGRSTHRPSFASSAGSTVIEPSTATATTTIEPTASELKVESRSGTVRPSSR